MSQIQDPRLANLIYNFMGQTMAELNKIDKNNVGGSSLRALKTDPKNVFRVNADASMSMLPAPPVNLAGSPPAVAPPIHQPIPQSTVPAAPAANVVNAGLNPFDSIPMPTPQPRVELRVKNSGDVRKEIDNIVSALNNIKNLLDE